MKRQDDPDKATRQKQFTEMMEAMEFVYDWLDSGKSFEELAIEVDIGAAASALSESSHEFFRLGFDLIRCLRDEGADRNEEMTYLRERGKALYEIN